MGGSVMNDRELLEAAAKASGIELGQWCAVYPDDRRNFFLLADREGCAWDPLNDDGDALRLAVSLSLLLLPYPDDKAVRVTGIDQRNTIVSWGTPPDPYAATRRAIVRAAAEFGSK
jgi:hypothetical protein